jgi:hypothetical protein
LISGIRDPLISGIRDPLHYIVVTAHFDHLGVIKGQVFNGADDNASVLPCCWRSQPA